MRRKQTTPKADKQGVPEIRGRVCAGCNRSRGVFSFYGAYWHPKCFRKATDGAKEHARAEQSAKREGEP